jgi:ABC-2 type transport system permease protein
VRGRSRASRRRSRTCSSTWSSARDRQGAPDRAHLAVAIKELHQIVRDRRTLGILLLFVPAFFLLLYGYALNFDIRDVRLAVQDRDRSAESRALVSAFVNSGYFQLVGYEDNDAALDALIDRNEARAVLVIPRASARTSAPVVPRRCR